jgi:hypothetical protein
MWARASAKFSDYCRYNMREAVPWDGSVVVFWVG